MGQTKFITQYPVHGNMYGSHVYAGSWKEAQELCWKRNIGEIIVGKTGYHKKDSEPSYHGMLHESCFLSYICLKANLLSVEEVLSDEGIVHELSHIIDNNKNTCTVDKLKARVAWLRKLTPGYEPV